MELILEVRTGRDHVTLACRGKLVEGKENEAFRRCATQLIDGFERMQLNLAGLRELDAAGLDALRRLLGRAAQRGRRLRIIANPLLQEKIRMAEITMPPAMSPASRSAAETAI